MGMQQCFLYRIHITYWDPHPHKVVQVVLLQCLESLIFKSAILCYYKVNIWLALVLSARRNQLAVLIREFSDFSVIPILFNNHFASRIIEF
jgi:hypothetical protein